MGVVVMFPVEAQRPRLRRVAAEILAASSTRRKHALWNRSLAEASVVAVHSAWFNEFVVALREELRTVADRRDGRGAA
jgi:hypothetical protein